MNAPQSARTATLTDELLDLAGRYSKPVTCSCGASWGPGDALRVIAKYLPNAVLRNPESRGDSGSKGGFGTT